MTHEDIKNNLLAYYDRELPESDRREITAHLESCLECREKLNSWESVRSVFACAPFPSSSENFVQKVMDRVSGGEETAKVPFGTLPKWLFPSLGYAFGFALMLVAIIHREPLVNASDVLLSDVPQKAQWTYADRVPDSSELMEM